MRSGGLIIAFILCIVLGLRALFRLWIMGRYTRCIVYVLIWFGYPYVAYSLFNFINLTGDSHIRVWILMPLILSFLLWFFFGFTMNKKVENLIRGVHYRDNKSGLRRMIGIFVALVALICWILGYNTYFGISDGISIILSFLISLIFFIAIVYAYTGKPYGKWDD